MLIKKIDLYKFYNLERKEGCKGYLTIYAETESREEMNMKDEFPAILIIPGGGYSFVSKREGEPIAIYYLSNGFISAVLDYSINVDYPRHLIEAMLALKYLKEHNRKYHIRKDKIACIGFSAGGNLAGLLSTIKEDEEKLVDGKVYRPDLTIMSYAVVSNNKDIWNEYTFRNAGFDSETGVKIAIEKRVDKATPPMFIWHTLEDGAVNPMNSKLLSVELKKNGIEHELVLFEKGDHGLSTCDSNTVYACNLNEGVKETAKWKQLSVDYLTENGFTSKFKK